MGVMYASPIISAVRVRVCVRVKGVSKCVCVSRACECGGDVCITDCLRCACQGVCVFRGRVKMCVRVECRSMHVCVFVCV